MNANNMTGFTAEESRCFYFLFADYIRMYTLLCSKGYLPSPIEWHLDSARRKNSLLNSGVIEL
jgi:hypothetical protein